MKLSETPLFFQTNIDLSTIEIKHYPAGYTIELEGSSSTYVGLILKGEINITTYTLQGTPINLTTLSDGMAYGDILIFGTTSNIFPGNVLSQTAVTLAIIPNNMIQFYLETNKQFLYNYLSMLSNKVQQYNRTSKLLSQDTLRDKLLYYLSEQKRLQKTNKIQLNMTKSELAQKLNVKRPSLSRELIHMKDEGLIDYNRWTITIKQ